MPLELHVLTPKVDIPRSAHRNLANAAIVQLCTDLGINPTTINDALSPGATPADVVTFESMVANILKTMTGAAHWYNAAVARRTIIGGGGPGTAGTIATGVTTYLQFAGRAFNATEATASMILPFAGTIVSLYVETLTAQPAGGSLVFTVRRNAVATAMVLTVAGGGAAAKNSVTGSIVFQQGDLISLQAVNNNAGASAQVSGFTMEFDQNG